MLEKIKNKLKTWLGIELIERRCTEIEKSVDVIIEKQLDSKSECEYDKLPPDVPFVDDDVYEHIPEDDPNFGSEATITEYAWWAIWSDGFAGPFENKEDAEFYLSVNNLYNRRYYSVSRLRKHYIQLKEKN